MAMRTQTTTHMHLCAWSLPSSSCFTFRLQTIATSAKRTCLFTSFQWSIVYMKHPRLLSLHLFLPLSLLLFLTSKPRTLERSDHSSEASTSCCCFWAALSRSAWPFSISCDWHRFSSGKRPLGRIVFAWPFPNPLVPAGHRGQCIYIQSIRNASANAPT